MLDPQLLISKASPLPLALTLPSLVSIPLLLLNFLADRMIEPGERIIVAEDKEAFLFRHKTVPRTQVVGSWSGSLKAAGEKIELRYNQIPFMSFTYKDWYARKTFPKNSLPSGFLYPKTSDILLRSSMTPKKFPRGT